MRWPVAETMRMIEAQFPPALVSYEALSSVRRLATKLPNATSSYYIEGFLAEVSSNLGLLACVEANHGGRQNLRDYFLSESSFLLPRDRWNCLREFCLLWENFSSLLYAHVPHVWLEFDASQLLDPAPLPNLLLCLAPHYFNKRGELEQSDRISTEVYEGIVALILGIFFEEHVGKSFLENLLHCFSSLPPDGQVIHLSMMFLRNPPEVKLHLSIPKHLLFDYLKKIGWSGPNSEIEEVLSLYCLAEKKIKIQLTIRETLSSKLDIEFHYDRFTKDHSELEFVLDQMVSKNLCASRQREELRNWIGSSSVKFPGRALPAVFSKWLSLKIVSENDRALYAKCYLGFMPSPLLF